MTPLRGILAYAFAGLMVGLLWPLVAAPFGSFAGLVAGLFIIAPVWYICHYRGWIPQSKDQVAIDMGAAIGMSVLVRGFLEHGLSQTLVAMPTFLCLAFGATLAGWLYATIERGGRK